MLLEGCLSFNRNAVHAAFLVEHVEQHETFATLKASCAELSRSRPAQCSSVGKGMIGSGIWQSSAACRMTSNDGVHLTASLRLRNFRLSLLDILHEAIWVLAWLLMPSDRGIPQLWDPPAAPKIHFQLRYICTLFWCIWLIIFLTIRESNLGILLIGQTLGSHPLLSRMARLTSTSPHVMASQEATGGTYIPGLALRI